MVWFLFCHFCRVPAWQRICCHILCTWVMSLKYDIMALLSECIWTNWFFQRGAHWSTTKQSDSGLKLFICQSWCVSPAISGKWSKEILVDNWGIGNSFSDSIVNENVCDENNFKYTTAISASFRANDLMTSKGTSVSRWLLFTSLPISCWRSGASHCFCNIGVWLHESPESSIISKYCSVRCCGYNTFIVGCVAFATRHG